MLEMKMFTALSDSKLGTKKTLLTVLLRCRVYFVLISRSISYLTSDAWNNLMSSGKRGMCFYVIEMKPLEC